jgi:toluene monooxygenase electron transfer component
VLCGEVESAWPEAPAAARLVPARREVLMCQARARSAVSLEIPRRASTAVQPPPSRFAATVQEHGLLTHDVVLMRLALSRGLVFQAGQFCLLAAPGIEGFRAYSMVHAPDGGATAEFIAKRKPGGALSGLLFSRQLPGVVFEGFGPLGRAVLQPQDDGDLLVMAGGTGIAGPMSVLETASRAGHFREHRASVYFGVRAARDLFFLERLSALAQQHPGQLQVVVAVSDEPVPAWESSLHPDITFVHAMLHEAPLLQPPQALGAPTAFLAGPPPAVEASTRLVMTRMGVPPQRIRFDRFG